ncbi:MAG: tRNA pseudouridine65 synthase [Oceanicoccus sp.]|jgi:tRNA pseudouridine65 synthase
MSLLPFMTIPLTIPILYQDEYLIAVNKPSGLLVHKSWVAKDAKEFALQTVRDMVGKHVFPVHRLDRPTSGILLFAFSGEIAQQVQSQWHEAKKMYLAVVRGWLKDTIKVDHALKGMADYGQDSETEQDAQTLFTPLAQIEVDAPIDKYPQSRFGLVRAQPFQGRTHQIRRHLKHLSHPIIGDARYGKGKYNRYVGEHFACPRLLLHAAQLTITHPITQQSIAINAPIEGDMAQLFERFNWPLTW